MNNSLKELADRIRYLPLASLVVIISGYIVFASFLDILSVYRSFLFVRGGSETNLAFYLITSIVITIYPMANIESRAVRYLHIILCAFYIFQIEYAGITGYMLNSWPEFPDYAKATYLEPFAVVSMLFVFSILATAVGNNRQASYLVILVTTVLAITASYHSYWSWQGLIQKLS